MPTEREEYLFDLQGYLVLDGALSKEEVAGINEAIDAIPPLDRGQWHEKVRRRDQHEHLGVNLQQICEAGEPFEKLIDHPSWIEQVRRFVGDDDGLQLAENLVNLRGPGESIFLHSGAHKRRIRTSYRYHNGFFRCGQINILVALTDIGPDDGATVVIPGSHKSNIIHPFFEVVERARKGDPEAARQAESADKVAGSFEVHLAAGDAILFVDSLCHGSVRRKNPGQRRILIYRYGPQWGHYFQGYMPSQALLSRLTPERRQIMQPIPPVYPPDEG